MFEQLVQKFCTIRQYPEEENSRTNEDTALALKNIRDLETKLIEKGQRESFISDILHMLNESNNGRDKIALIIERIKLFSGIEAIAIRLREESDFPYHVYHGFSQEFVADENYLCGPNGLECMCGAVLEGRTDPLLPFFTRGGSFWTNDTAALVSTGLPQVDFTTRNRCLREGYASIALIPLRAGANIVGLLQLNDRRKDRFDVELIGFYESLGATIGVALRRMLTETSLITSESHYRALLQVLPHMVFRMDAEGKLIEVEGPQDFFSQKPEDPIGMNLRECVPKRAAHKMLDMARRCLDGSKGMLAVEQIKVPISGGDRWWEIRIVKYNEKPDEVLGVVIDVTLQRKRAKKNGA